MRVYGRAGGAHVFADNLENEEEEARVGRATVPERVERPCREVDVRLPGKGHSKAHGARPVHLIITVIKWIQTSRRDPPGENDSSGAE